MKNLCFFIAMILFLLTIGAYADVNTPPSVNPPSKLPDPSKGYITGKIIWQGHNLKGASVQVFKDPKMKDIYTKGLLLDPEGTYGLEMDDPGTYYMIAFVDDNGNDKFDAGDGMGMYGVMDWGNSNQQPEPVKIEVGKSLTDMDIEVTATVNEKGQLAPLQSTTHPNMKTGITGRLILPDYKFVNTIVFVYTDPTWGHRVAQADVLENGEYAVSVPAGKYYLLAVIDENKSDLLDAGDRFGVWGMTRFGMYPKPIIIQEKVRIDRNILIIGKINEKGKPVALQNPIDEKIVQQDANIVISGKVIWSAHDVKNSLVQAYSDPSLTSAIAIAKTDNKGNFRLNLPEGEYYITAGVDVDGDGKYTKGDGIGAYGSDDISSLNPKKLVVTKDKTNSEIDIIITTEFDSNGQLKSIEKKELNPEKEVSIEPNITGISGKIIWSDHKFTDAIIVFAKDSSFKDGIRVPLKLDDKGVYTCSTEAGAHHIMVIVDYNYNEKTDTGDGVGFYGTGYHGDDHWGESQPINVFNGRTTPYINIRISAVMDKNNKPSLTQDGVRMYFGDANSVFNTAQDTQEWWYWSKGVAFTFTKTDESWNLTDVYQFTPKEVSNFTSKKTGIIYCTFDNNIWVVNPDGSDRRRIAPGKSVTGTFEGDRLLFFDGYEGLGIYTPLDQILTDLDWSQVSYQASLSNDGKSIAFARELNGNKQIVIRSIENGNEIIVPGLNTDASYPSWSSDGELLAYSASSTVKSDQLETLNRDIYYYDIIAKMTEKVSTSPQDDFDPAWSPGELKMLVFCRSDGKYSQLWLASFDAYGKPSERQLTKYGGLNPAWSPDGDKIIYENNAQLWTVNLDGTNENPILLNDEPVFGLDPFWTR